VARRRCPGGAPDVRTRSDGPMPFRSTPAGICSSARIEWRLARSPKIDERVRRPSPASACWSTCVQLAQRSHARWMRGRTGQARTEPLTRQSNDWRSAARPRGSAATEGRVSCNVRVMLPSLRCWVCWIDLQCSVPCVAPVLPMSRCVQTTSATAGLTRSTWPSRPPLVRTCRHEPQRTRTAPGP
jgi:hypothetical protein